MTFIISSVVRLMTVGVGRAGYTGDVLLTAAIVLVPSAFMLYIGHRVSEKLDLHIIKKLIYGFLGCFGAVIAVNDMIIFLNSSQ